MERRGPGTVGEADNARFLQFIKLGPGLLELEGIEAASFGENRRPCRLNVVDYAVLRGMVEKISGENCGIFGKELANLWLDSIEIGENKRGGGGHWRRSGPAKRSVGGFVEDLAGSDINKEVMGSKKIGA